MTTIQGNHLTYDDLLRTLVDMDDLDVEAREHFESCPRCRNQADRLAQRYNKMGQMARDLAPKPSSSFRVSEQRTTHARWQFRSAMALGVAGVMVFFLTVWWPQSMPVPDPASQNFAQTVEEENRLMAQIDALVENALPKGYQEVAMITDSDITDLSEDLIDWIVPSIEDSIEESEPIG